MDFQPTEDQKALREGIRAFLEGQLPFDRIPELEKSRGFDRALWGELAEICPGQCNVKASSASCDAAA